MDSEEKIRLFWQVCQIPNFRKNMPEAHVNLVRRVFLDLADYGHIDERWVHNQMDRLDNVKG